MTPLDPDWSQVVEELGPKLYRYFSGNFVPSLASDLVQETLIRLVQKHREGAIDYARGNLYSFAFGIAKFVRLEEQRKNLHFSIEVAGVEPESVTPLVHESDPVAHLRWAIRQLNSIEQEILLRLIDEECKLEQIAYELEIPLGTVKSHVHRAKEKIRSLMEVYV